MTGAAPVGNQPAWKQFNPYKGLPALTSADAAFFFGREDVTAQTLDALRTTSRKVIVMVGASGVGKSSVAQAGVLAALKSQRWPGDDARPWPSELADSRAWLQLNIRLGDSPLKELALAFVSLMVDASYEQDREADGWVARFKEGAGLAGLLRAVRKELDERTGSDALRRFVRPAERLGARFDSRNMAAQIAAATAGEAGALPLLSYLLSDMWMAMQARGDGILRWSERPELIDIAAPLRERAERYRLAQPAREAALRRLFTLRLTHLPREGEPVRRRARKTECQPGEWQIAEMLAEPAWRLLSARTNLHSLVGDRQETSGR